MPVSVLDGASLHSGFDATTLRPRVEASADRLLGVPGQVAVGAVDHRHAGAHDSGQLEDRDTGGECLSGEGVAQLEWAALPDPGRLEHRVPVARPPGVEANVPAPDSGEDERLCPVATAGEAGISSRHTLPILDAIIAYESDARLRSRRRCTTTPIRRHFESDLLRLPMRFGGRNPA